MRHAIARRVPLWARMGGRRIAYYGRAETCEFCGSHVRRFLTNGSNLPILTERKVIGGIPVKNDRCPVCHAQDRTRLMKYYLETQLDADRSGKKLRILHVAPDLGLVLWIMRQPGIAYTGTDIDRARYSHIQNFVEADLTDLPFADESFDVVICSHVLEHVPDDRAAMRQMCRVLAPGGVALILVPFATDGGELREDPSVEDPAERERLFGQWDHIRLYTYEAMIARLEEAGFDVSVFDAYAANAAEAERRRLNRQVLLPVARRPAGGPSSVKAQA